MHRPAGVREPHHEHRELGQLSIEPDADPAEVDLRLGARRMQLRHRHGHPAGLQLAPQAGHAGAHHPPEHPVAPREAAHRHALFSSVSSDTLTQLHLRQLLVLCCGSLTITRA
ncbi:MAG: hypothetical protein OXH19_07575 [Chloroflexi bacterium]|nr:hypothetical protein [Chloroflexota bacterium]MCY3587825.1 hypothetical protein [Chloroflexota bacterium]MDE2708975.1 hypothetical protein [Chloroflexota bacterium]